MTVKCSRCAVSNREGARYCRACGQRLAPRCPACGTVLDAGSAYCDHCGGAVGRDEAAAPAVDYGEPRSYTPRHLTERILAGRAALQGERKVVTVLFADVASYTALSEALDPEDLHRIMDGCFRILLDEVHRYEGTINQFTGDGVMALFGAPIALEDHAQRACRAALSMQAAVGAYGQRVRAETGVAFAMRIGLHSGPVVVGAIGDDLRMDYTAFGDTANLAARVQQAATPGEVWVSEPTRHAVRAYFHDEFAGDVMLKGKAGPRPLYRLLGERRGVQTRFEAGLAQGMTPFAGRAREMAVLGAAFGRARGADAQIVDVVGEPGVGKSRLLHEFQGTVAGEASIVTGTALPYGRRVPFLTVIDVLKHALGLVDGAPADEVRARAAERTGRDMAAAMPFVLHLLALRPDDAQFQALSPEGRKFGTFEAVKSLLLGVAERRPLVVILEDVQWMDKTSEEFFTYFSRCLGDHRVLMLAAYRPEGAPPWTHEVRYQRLGLETLDRAAAAAMLRNVLAGAGLEPSLEARIVETSGGNPFFLEEIVRDLRDRGDLVERGGRFEGRRPLHELQIPETVQGVLAARMDRLGEELKGPLQVAAVIGRRFPVRLLQRVLDAGDDLGRHLETLADLGILHEEAVYPELEYAFAHALIQDVAYATLLRQRRQAIHGRIARAIEAEHAADLETHDEALAHHWESSDEPGRALAYLVRAGEKSGRTQAADAAAHHFTRAMRLLDTARAPRDDRVLLRIRLGRADPLHASGDIEGSLNDYREAIRLARALGDEPTVLQCYARVPGLIYNTTFKDEVPELCDAGLALARKLGDRGAEAQIAGLYAYWRYLWRHTQEQQALEDALALATAAGSSQAVFLVRTLLGVTERWAGRPQRSLRATEGLAEALQSAFNIYLASSLSFIRGWALTDAGRYHDAIEHLTRWIALVERNAIVTASARCYNGLGWTHAEVYDLDRARALNRRALEQAIALGQSPALVISAAEMRAMAETNLAENSLELGMLDDAWDRVARFEAVARDPAYDMLRHRWSSRMDDVRAAILLRRGDLDGAQALLEPGLEAAVRRGMAKYAGRKHRALGEVMARRGAPERAERHLHDALGALEGVGNPRQLWTTEAALARLYRQTGRHDLARARWEVARRLVVTTADALRDEALRATFLGAAPVREILEQAAR
jgi:class 3 adenylate cyclase/tetratricopeptide (TPR) repeat protein